MIFFLFVALILFVEASHARFPQPRITELINGEIVELHPMMKKVDWAEISNKKSKLRCIGHPSRRVPKQVPNETTRWENSKDSFHGGMTMMFLSV
ncbi:unnamed protein product [Eruca vesicaria subsp. sativa]|uniref:Uncharacterized protein n=1 Tax=Eruca vesicaria subsp. sativa TaxID=29727 RepID=A0ABC8KYM9_ERUVS|nr:unnamed protein product [Eruca vesicaria subsp. sativa]